VPTTRRQRSPGAPAAPASERSAEPRQGRPPVSVAVLVRAQSEVDAGDRCAAAGERDRALSHYGRALNEYLHAGMFGLANSIARRMIDRYPDVVRARLTLAALTLAEGLRHLSAEGIRNSCSDFREYVQAAEAAGQGDRAMRQLRRFAEATESPTVRAQIAGFLAQLGDEQGARALLTASPEDTAAAPREDQRARWMEILLA
jgi:hypothetical protein